MAPPPEKKAALDKLSLDFLRPVNPAQSNQEQVQRSAIDPILQEALVTYAPKIVRLLRGRPPTTPTRVKDVYNDLRSNDPNITFLQTLTVVELLASKDLIRIIAKDEFGDHVVSLM